MSPTVPSVDPWKVLGLRRGAAPEIIRTAWRNGVMLYHPDTATGSGDAEKFRLVNEAYRALRDNPEATYEDGPVNDWLPSDPMPERVWRGFRHPQTGASWWGADEVTAEPETSWWDDEEPAVDVATEPDTPDVTGSTASTAPFPDIDYIPEPDLEESELYGSDLDDPTFDADLSDSMDDTGDEGWDFDAANIDPLTDGPDGPFESNDLVDLGTWQRKKSVNPLTAFRSRINSGDPIEGGAEQEAGEIGAVSTLPELSDPSLSDPDTFDSDDSRSHTLAQDGSSPLSGVLATVSGHFRSLANKLPSSQTDDGPRMSALDEARSHSFDGADAPFDAPAGPVMHQMFIPAGVVVIVGLRTAVQAVVPVAANLSIIVIVIMALVATVAIRIFVSRKLIPDMVGAVVFPVLAVFLAAGDVLALILAPMVAVGAIVVVRARRQMAEAE